MKPKKTAPSSQETIAAATRFADSVTTGPDRRHRASELASKLIQLANDFPEFRRDLQKAQGCVSWQGQRTPDRDHRAVLRALQGFKPEVPATKEEIATETGLTKKETKAVLDYLVETGRVKKRPQGGKTERARGARTQLYFLPHTPTGSAFTHPLQRELVEDF